MFGFLSRQKGPFKAELRPSGSSVEVQPKDNLLKAALDAGLAWPHSCRVGSCGTCRCRLISGKIKELNDFSYVLDAEELDRGMILACQTLLKSDAVVEVTLGSADSQLAQPAFVPGIIKGSNLLTHDILELQIALEWPLPPYLAGQYAEISVQTIEKPRSYSFARAPETETEGYVTFHVRHVPNGEMSGWLHAKSRVGERVTVSGPYGSFYLRNTGMPMLCIAGGSGMAPIKALLEHLSNRGFDRHVTYLFGARTQADIYCLDDLARIGEKANGHFKFQPVLSNEPEDSNWSGPRGYVTDYLAELNLDLASCEAYLCGPPPMIDAAIEVLTKGGVSSEKIFFDKFLDASHLPGGKR